MRIRPEDNTYYLECEHEEHFFLTGPVADAFAEAVLDDRDYLRVMRLLVRPIVGGDPTAHVCCEECVDQALPILENFLRAQGYLK